MSFRTLRHVALDDAQRQAFGNRRLANAGLADQHRIVLGAPRQHLDGAADFLVAADHRIKLAVLGRFGEVAGIFLQRVIALLGRSRIRRAALANGVDGLIKPLRRDPCRSSVPWRHRSSPWPAPATAVLP